MGVSSSLILKLADMVFLVGEYASDMVKLVDFLSERLGLFSGFDPLNPACAEV